MLISSDCRVSLIATCKVSEILFNLKCEQKGKKHGCRVFPFVLGCSVVARFSYSRKFSGATVSTESCDVKEKKKTVITFSSGAIM